MGLIGHRAWISMLALIASAAFWCAATVAQAVPSAIATSAVEQKQAEQSRALTELEQMREDLATQMRRYIEINQQMQETRRQIVEAEAQLADQDVSLSRTQEMLENRAVQMYRGEKQGLLHLLLRSSSIQDFLARAHYLVIISGRDADLLRQVRLERTETLWLQETLAQRQERLQAMQLDADDQRSRIESDMAAQQVRADQLGADLAELMRQQAATTLQYFQGGDPVGQFSPDMIITDTNFRGIGATTTVADIQAFLEQQPGTLARYRGKDHAGRTRTAAQMIFEASQVWHVSPKVILVTLQKEQSLLSRTSPPQKAYDWAMGCGRADSRTFYEYKGFGNQIYWGAQKLDKNSKPWKPGITMTIDGSKVHPTNSSTYSLYKYTPHLRGCQSFWMLYWRYFGDPLR